MRRIGYAIVAALVSSCVAAPVTTVASPSPSATATAARSPSASPSESPGPLNMVTAVGTIPRSFHYFDVGQGASYRILLFDEDKTDPPIVVLTSGQPTMPAGPDTPSDAFSASADGRVLVVARHQSAQQMTYYVLRPETGELRTLFSGGSDLGPPVISPDGQRIGFARASADPAVNGVWTLAVSAAADRTRLVSDLPRGAGSPPRPLAWSDDGKWLAISPVLGAGGAEVAVVDPTAGETYFNATTNIFEGGSARVLGSGYAVDWRGGEHNVLVTTSTRDVTGGRTYIYAADVTAGPNANRELYAPTRDVTLGPAVWHPSLDRYATIERPSLAGPTTPVAIWVRRLDGTASKVAESAFLSVPWWSRDGTKLFSFTGGDDSTGGISNLLGTGGGTAFCLRGGTPPRCT